MQVCNDDGEPDVDVIVIVGPDVVRGHYALNNAFCLGESTFFGFARAIRQMVASWPRGELVTRPSAGAEHFQLANAGDLILDERLWMQVGGFCPQPNFSGGHGGQVGSYSFAAFPGSRVAAGTPRAQRCGGHCNGVCHDPPVLLPSSMDSPQRSHLFQQQGVVDRNVSEGER